MRTNYNVYENRLLFREKYGEICMIEILKNMMDIHDLDQLF